MDEIVAGVIRADNMLVLLIPRDDFAKLMDLIAKIEEADTGCRLFDKRDVPIYEIDDIDDLSRIASDLSQQADAQDGGARG